MAFKNEYGQNISYECEDLIAELNQDIQEFGGDLLLFVITEIRYGVRLYIDYDFYEKGVSLDYLKLRPGEEVIKMTATALMTLLKIQNEIC